ncbi:hypothetical protein Thal_1129 [Thermocrinis albus DSM 14484]|uniref:Uncharacterized protein n=1 Tax=Thermocrinis albus (strain DSM 14484 / JCM 11386 / HI 11/12) TaxID=638303 RepID=D3SLY1_THEAH|nr:hypothetical protein [Thermocrinis albus]ADC89761.1 hypothetical protein Thal_1129 [Thermocrinis albus DSM 14484]
MSDLLTSLLRSLLALAIVLVLILLILPYVVPLLERLSLGRRGQSSTVKVVRVLHLAKDVVLLELEIRGKLLVVLVTQHYAEVLYRDDTSAS